MCAKLLQSHTTLCDTMDCSPPGSSVHGILQTRVMCRVTIPFSGGSFLPRDQTWVWSIQVDSLVSQPAGKPCMLYVCVLSHFSCVRLYVTLWTVACQALLSMSFSRQEYWSWLSCPPPGHLPITGIEITSPRSLALPGQFVTTSTT